MMTSIYAVKAAIFSAECHFSKIENAFKKGLKGPRQFFLVFNTHFLGYFQ